MPDGISSLDLLFLVKELRTRLRNGAFRKIYQYGSAKNKQFLFELYIPTKGTVWLYIDDTKVVLTKQKIAASQEPPSFCMFLRKHLLNKRIRDITQHGFDRIIEISTDDHILIIELFSEGNVILCDTSYKIIMPHQIQRWRDRTIKPKVAYTYPPQNPNPYDLSLAAFRRLVVKSDKKLVVFLATRLGFGAVYANEICARAGVEDGKASTEVTTGETVRLYETIQSLPEQFQPVAYENVIAPFVLKTKKGEKYRVFDSFTEALDEFFSGKIVVATPGHVLGKKPHKAAIELTPAEKKKTEMEKTERILQQFQEAEAAWAQNYLKSKEAADAIYTHYSSVKTILEGIERARRVGLSWDEIKAKLLKEESAEAAMVKEIREQDGTVVIGLEGKKIELDMRKSPEENAAVYYEESKKARKKLERTKTAKTEIAIPQEKPAEPAPAPKKKKRGHWYDKFKHFFSSDGTLVVAGKSATQNENLIKKRTAAQDLVYHANIAGAAFVVTKGKELSPETRKEAAEFAAVNSKAWSRGLGKIDVFEVRLEQVSKTPPSGEYLAKGSFMIRGERNWFRDVELKLSVGVKLEEDAAKVVYGPVFAVRKNSDYFVTIKPGYKKSLELSKLIKNKILVKARPEHKSLIQAIPLSDFQNSIPGGTGDIVQYG